MQLLMRYKAVFSATITGVTIQSVFVATIIDVTIDGQMILTEVPKKIGEMEKKLNLKLFPK